MPLLRNASHFLKVSIKEKGPTWKVCRWWTVEHRYQWHPFPRWTDHKPYHKSVQSFEHGFPHWHPIPISQRCIFGRSGNILVRRCSVWWSRVYLPGWSSWYRWNHVDDGRNGTGWHRTHRPNPARCHIYCILLDPDSCNLHIWQSSLAKYPFTDDHDITIHTRTQLHSVSSHRNACSWNSALATFEQTW